MADIIAGRPDYEEDLARLDRVLGQPSPWALPEPRPAPLAGFFEDEKRDSPPFLQLRPADPPPAMAQWAPPSSPTGGLTWETMSPQQRSRAEMPGTPESPAYWAWAQRQPPSHQPARSFADTIAYYTPPGLEWIARYGKDLALLLAQNIGPQAGMKDMMDSAREFAAAAQRGDIPAAASNFGLAVAAPFLGGFGGAIRKVGKAGREISGRVAEEAAMREAAAKASAAGLPMDEASRMARAADQGWNDTFPGQTFFRGQKEVPTQFPDVTYFARGRDTAAGHARGGGHMGEYLLAPKRPLSFAQDTTAADWLDLVNAAEKVHGPEAAKRLVDGLPFNSSISLAQFRGWAKANPSEPLLPGSLTAHLLGKQLGDEVAVLRAAGFDAVDTGAHVRMLSSANIRDVRAAFNPADRSLREIFKSVVPVAATGAAAATFWPEGRSE